MKSLFIVPHFSPSPLEDGWGIGGEFVEHALHQPNGIPIQRAARIESEGNRLKILHSGSTVHFSRFELTETMAVALKYGESLAMGVDHPRYTSRVEVDNQTRSALVNDFVWRCLRLQKKHGSLT